MPVLKCKMCGGDILLNEEKTFGTCESCGSTMTLPKVSDEQRAALFNRGNHFRRTGDFDKALAIYENIVREDDSDAEAHWCCVLCRFGIEYVEDPNTFEFIPTCHRASFDSILEDVDYLAAIEHSDGITRRQYQRDAAKIAEVQKGILATSQNEKPFDVFICYKETDDLTGQRTKDSIDAQEIYYQLTNEGYRVFFSRITLEDKAGTEYEPYIFAALNSAKVMIVIGSKPEYFNAVWVKNEWSRFLALMRKDRSKLLLPCYKGMDPYDLPEQLSVLQSYDMTKIGFIQDLIRGIKKVVKSEEQIIDKKETVVEGTTNVVPLLKRAFLFLENGEWNSANEYCERVLDVDPENADAYIGKLLAELNVSRREDLENLEKPFDSSNNYKLAVRFGNESINSELSTYIKHINERNENKRKQDIYNNAIAAMKAAASEEEYRNAAGSLKTISGFLDADALAEKCMEKADEYQVARLTSLYDHAVSVMRSAKDEKEFKAAAKAFKAVSGFNDADGLAEQCLNDADACRKDSVYATAKSQMTENSVTAYESAIDLFNKISGWKDADEQIHICLEKIEKIKAELKRQAEQNRAAEEKAAKRKRKKIIATAALSLTVIVISFVYLITVVPRNRYNKALELFKGGDYASALEIFNKISNYRDSLEYADKCTEQIKKEEIREEIKNCSVGDVVLFGKYEQDNNTKNGGEDIEWVVLAVKNGRVLLLSKYGLDSQNYDNNAKKGSYVTWDKSSVRTWLNDSFYDNAFDAAEKRFIVSTKVTAKDDYEDPSCGNDTTDKVFLLNISEIRKYDVNVDLKHCKATKYAVSQGVQTFDEDGCWWWLRGPYDGQYGNRVDNAGVTNHMGFHTGGENDAVRPVIWVSIEN